MFPLARLRSFDTDSGEGHTAEVGTASYCAPEQLAGNVYDHRVDIYAVGIIVIELFVPFSTGMVRVPVAPHGAKRRRTSMRITTPITS